MLKKIMNTLATLVFLVIAGIGGLWYYAQSQGPQTEGESKLLSLCLYGAGGQSRENCQCVIEGARSKLTEEEMPTAWEIQLGSRQAGMIDQQWRFSEEDRRDQRDYEELKLLWDQGTISERQFDRRLSEANRINSREVEQEARAPHNRIKSIINSIVSDCGF